MTYIKPRILTYFYQTVKCTKCASDTIEYCEDHVYRCFKCGTEIKIPLDAKEYAEL